MKKLIASLVLGLALTLNAQAASAPGKAPFKGSLSAHLKRALLITTGAAGMCVGGACTSSVEAPPVAPRMRSVVYTSLPRIGQSVQYSYFDMYSGRTQTRFAVVKEVNADSGRALVQYQVSEFTAQLESVSISSLSTR